MDGVTGRTLRQVQGLEQFPVRENLDGRYDVRVDLNVTIPCAVDLLAFREWMTRILLNNGVRVGWIDVVEA